MFLIVMHLYVNPITLLRTQQVNVPEPLNIQHDVCLVVSLYNDQQMRQGTSWIY
jgi:hypothetical protein